MLVECKYKKLLNIYGMQYILLVVLTQTFKRYEFSDQYHVPVMQATVPTVLYSLIRSMVYF